MYGQSKITQNNLQNGWSEKVPQAMEENENVARNSIHVLRKTSDNETFLNKTTQAKEKELVPNMNLSEDSTYQRRSRSTRCIPVDEMEMYSANLTLKHTPSTDTLYSRGSRNYSRYNPVESHRSFRHSPNLHSPLSRGDNKDGINIIMLVGFAIGIACGTVFNIAEVYLQWFQANLVEIQTRIMGGKTIKGFYAQEESIRKKMLYGPLSGLLLVLQSVINVILFSIEFLKKPAPKTLVNNVLMRYLNE